MPPVGPSVVQLGCTPMPDEFLKRLAAVDWRNKPEATIASQLIMPMLMLLGYGEHTLHKVVEQPSYNLKDPYTSKGSRRIRLDYLPTILEEGLWVMEAKGTDAKVTAKTLGQVRDYTVHPEVRAALIVTLDANGLQVYDPWDLHWDEPILHVAVNDIAGRIEEIRAVLGADRVAAVIRRRHFDHLRAALSASLQFAVLSDAEKEFRSVLDEARASIDKKRRELREKARHEQEELAKRVQEASGVWGAAQSANSPWTGTVKDAKSFAAAVLAQREAQRPTEILIVKSAIEAVYRKRIPEGADAFRPLWWLHVCRVASWPRLVGEAGCDPYASDEARRALRDCLLGFPDDPVQAASWRLQRSLIPLLVRQASGAEFERRSAELERVLPPEDIIRYDIGPSWMLGHWVRMVAIQALTAVDPWDVETLEDIAAQVETRLDATPLPEAVWHGTASDPWLTSWRDTDQLLACSLDVLLGEPAGDDLIRADPELVGAIREAAASEKPLLERWAQPLLERLGSE